MHNDHVGSQIWFYPRKSIIVVYHINKRQDRNHMILFINAEKEFDKILHLFIIKILTKMGVEGTYLNNENHLQQTHSQFSTQGWKVESLSAKFCNKTRMPPPSIQHSIGTPNHSNEIRKINKSYPNWKGTGKTITTCRWHDTLYRKS